MTNIEAKLNHYQEQVSDDPENGRKRTELISLLLEEGLLFEAIETVKNANQDLPKKLRLPENYHKPLIKLFGERGEVEVLEMLVSDLEANYEVEDDQTIKRMVRKGRRYITKKYKIFPSSIKEEDWWKGPHLLDPEEISEWFPGNITIKDGEIRVLMADRNDINYLQVQNLSLDEEEFKSYFKNTSQLKGLLSGQKGSFFVTEMGFTQKEDLVIKIHK